MGCARTGSRWRWPNRIIPYTINDEDFPANTSAGQAERQAIQAAINAWNSQSVVTIQPRNGELNWVEFVAGNEAGACSSSHTGKVYLGRQFIYCDPTSGVLSHEIGHAIGLWHEQQREDRENWVTVHLENVRSDKRDNFYRHIDDGTDLGAYDYASVMHYSAAAFAVDWRPGKGVVGHLSKDAPALAAIAGKLHMLHIGEESNDIWHSWTTDGEHWTKDERVKNHRSRAAPAVVEWGGALHMVHIGDSSTDLWYSRSTADRKTFAADKRVDGQKSKASPSLAVFGNELHMVHLGGSSNDIYHSWTSDGQNWAEQKIRGQTSKASPALASFNGRLDMVHLGDTSNNLWHSWSTDGRDWTTNVPISDQQSQAAVALAEFEGVLHMAHIGDTSRQMWHSRFDGNDWSENHRRDNATSRRVPALASFGGDLHMVHVGRSSDLIYHTVLDKSLDSIVSPEPIGTNTISPGDISAVASMYAAI